MIYLDNAATTFPKPEQVINNTFDFAKNLGANPGRAAHKMSVATAKEVYGARENIAGLINAKDEMDIAFTKNCTEALNLGLFANVKEGFHVISSVFEHNSIIRVLEHYKKTRNITVTYLEPENDGVLNADDVLPFIKKDTSLIALNHANNLIGTYNDIQSIGKLASEKGILFLVDAAQSIGKKQIDVQKMHIDLLCAPGHKSLFGLSGTGFIYYSKNANKEPMFRGGTGSFSNETIQPTLMPDMIEAGTVNFVGIKSVKEGIDFINETTIEKIENRENNLTKYILEEFAKIENVKLYTPKNTSLAGIVLFNIANKDCSEVAAILNEKYDIAVRSGLHCNPYGHKYLGTIDSAAVRASLSYFNTLDDADNFIKAVYEIAN